MSASLIGMIIVAILLAWFGVVALLWRWSQTMEALTGQTARDRSAERHDHNQQVQKLLEKLYSKDHVELSRQHGNERVHQIQMDAQVAAAAIRAKKPIARPVAEADMEFCDPADAVHMQ